MKIRHAGTKSLVKQAKGNETANGRKGHIKIEIDRSESNFFLLISNNVKTVEACDIILIMSDH